MSKNKDHLKVTTGEFRVSYPHLFKPTPMLKDGKPKGPPMYSIEMLFDKTQFDMKDLRKVLFAAATDKWGKKENWPNPMKNPIKDGDKPRGKKKEVRPEHEGMWVVKASSSGEFAAPIVVGSKNQPLKESELYPGCYARAALLAHAYEVSDEVVGVKFILDGVQKTNEGEPLGNAKSADQLFGAVETEEFSDDESFGASEETESDDEGYF